MDVSRLDYDEIVALYHQLRERFQNGSLAVLDDDAMTSILTFLKPADRISLIQAARENTEDGSSNLSAPFAAQLIFDTAYGETITSLHALSDVIHYLVPSCCNLGFYVFIDWSPFGSMAAREVAVIHWSEAPPHARIDIYDLRLKRKLRSILARGSGCMRVTVHVASDRQGPAQARCVKLRNRPTEVPLEPIQTRMIHMLPKSEWIDPQMLLSRPYVRKNIPGIMF